MEWLKNNEAGGGAFRVEKWTPGQEVVYRALRRLEIRAAAASCSG